MDSLERIAAELQQFSHWLQRLKYTLGPRVPKCLFVNPKPKHYLIIEHF